MLEKACRVAVHQHNIQKVKQLLGNQKVKHVYVTIQPRAQNRVDR